MFDISSQKAVFYDTCSKKQISENATFLVIILVKLFMSGSKILIVATLHS